MTREHLIGFDKLQRICGISAVSSTRSDDLQPGPSNAVQLFAVGAVLRSIPLLFVARAPDWK